EGIRLRVRMGLHCGPATVSGGEYVGLAVHEVARICAAAHGGQVICSSAVAEAFGPDGGDLRFNGLGSYRLRDIPDPWTLYQVCAPGLEEHFPPLRGAVREGGSLVTVWRREAGPAPGPGWRAPRCPPPRGARRPPPRDRGDSRSSSPSGAWPTTWTSRWGGRRTGGA